MVEREDWEWVLKRRVDQLKRLEEVNAPDILIRKQKEMIATARRKLGQH